MYLPLIHFMEDAASRHERLRALKQAAEHAAEGGGAQLPSHDSDIRDAEADKPTLRFRNYAPKDKKIVHEQVGAPAGRARAHAGACRVLGAPCSARCASGKTSARPDLTRPGLWCCCSGMDTR